MIRAAAMPIAVGARIGPYEILGWLGAGGMGDVYRARDARLARDVAIKVIPEALATDASRVRRFEQEARAAGQLNHPNILAVYDVGLHAGAPYIVSELLEGDSLRSRLQAGALPSRKAVDYARQIAEGLAAAHDKSIVHRDVKPDNLFITSDGRIKILDFGIAKLTRPSDEMRRSTRLSRRETEAGMVVGTAGYMSPEQVRGEAGRCPLRHLQPRNDSLRDADRAVAVHPRDRGRDDDRHPEGGSAPPLSPDVSPALARIVARCLEKTREMRFQSARDLAFGLEVLSETGGRRARHQRRALFVRRGLVVPCRGSWPARWRSGLRAHSRGTSDDPRRRCLSLGLRWRSRPVNCSTGTAEGTRSPCRRTARGWRIWPLGSTSERCRSWT